MQLTKNSIGSIISSGAVDNSTFAERFLEEIRRKAGINAISCYLQSSRHIILPEEKRVFFSRHPKPSDLRGADFADECILTIYADCAGDDARMKDEEIKNIISTIFNELAEREGINIEYPRSFLHKEEVIYGWLPRKPGIEPDKSCIIQPDKSPRKTTIVVLESLPDLALWHYLSDSLNEINSTKIVKNRCEHVYCGWDNKQFSMTLYVVIPEYTTGKNDISALREDFMREILPILKRRDKLHIIDRYCPSPVFVSWEKLPPDVRFGLIRN